MPQNLTLVYDQDGNPLYMHSIDAAEAVRLGDYTMAPPSGKEPTPEQMQVAQSRIRGMAPNPHPELQTPEQRAETRRMANEEAAAQSGQTPQEPLGVRQALGAPVTPPPASAPSTSSSSSETSERARSSSSSTRRESGS